MRYYGESNVPGAPGIQFAGGNFMGGEGSAINPEALKRDARKQKIYNKGINTDNPNEKEIFLRRTGPQLPLAGGFPSIGNMGGLVAQAMPSAEFLQDVPAQPGSVDLSQFSDVLDRLTEQAIEKSKYGRPLQRVEYPF